MPIGKEVRNEGCSLLVCIMFDSPIYVIGQSRPLSSRSCREAMVNPQRMSFCAAFHYPLSVAHSSPIPHWRSTHWTRTNSLTDSGMVVDSA